MIITCWSLLFSIAMALFANISYRNQSWLLGCGHA
uniref:Uncharacterized protein n=1 Tax=Rhizophora mucronata TaxID=61149 RepID=A0A2P2PUN1_RHIMU